MFLYLPVLLHSSFFYNDYLLYQQGVINLSELKQKFVTLFTYFLFEYLIKKNKLKYKLTNEWMNGLIQQLIYLVQTKFQHAQGQFMSYIN